MTRPHLIARLIFAAMGVHLLMNSLGVIGSVNAALSFKYSPETFTTKMLIFSAQFVIIFAVSLILLFRSDGLTRMIAGPDTTQCEKVSSRWIIASLRMTACFCGLLIIYHRIELLFYYIPTIINGPNILSYMTLEGQSSQLSAKTLVAIFVEVIKWIFAIYLIFGAPHYVRRQMRVIAVKQNRELKYEQE